MYLADELLGPRTRWSYAWRSLARSGARLAFGTDCPVEPYDPWACLQAAVLRQHEGAPESGWYPEERLSPEEALQAYTSGGAWASGEEAVKGRLAPGMLADFFLASENPLECEPDKIADIRVLATYIGGREVYTADQRTPSPTRDGASKGLSIEQRTADQAADHPGNLRARIAHPRRSPRRARRAR
ncbi:MAG: amidohydrolase family protein [Chloroflexia bacterium]